MSTSINPRRRKHIETELTRLEELIESSMLHYQCMDAKGNIVKVNSSWLKTLGYDEEEVLNKWFGEFLTEESKNHFKKKYKDSIEKNDNVNIELTLICKDESRMYADFSCIGNDTRKGAPYYSHCIFQNITKLRETERALQESEKKYSQLVELSNVGIFEYDVNAGEFTYINSVIRKELGIDPNSDTIPNLAEYLTPDSVIHFRDRLNLLQNGKTIPKTFEYQLTNARGKEIWVQLSNNYIHKENGLCIIGVAQNITSRKNLEIELKDYHQRLEQITRNLPAVIFQFTKEKGKPVFQYFSDNIKNYSGYTKDQIMGNAKIVTSLIRPQDYEHISKTIEDAAESGLPVQFDYPVTTEDGIKRWSRTTILPKVLDQKNTIWTGITSDITEEVEIKENLAKIEARYKALVNSAAPGISTMSPSGIITSVNPRLCEISGYDEDDLVGEHFLNIPAFYKKDAPKYLKLYKNAKKSIFPEEPVSFDWKHKNGERRWGEGFLSSIVEDDKIIGYQAVLTDTTNKVLLKKQEDQRSREIELLFQAAVKLLNIEDETKLFEFIADTLTELIPGSYIVVNSVSDAMDVLTVEAVRIPDKPVHLKILKLLENKLSGRKFTMTPDTFRYAIEGRLMSYHDTIYELALKQIPKNVCDQIEKLINLGSILEISMGTSVQIMGGCAIFLPKGNTFDNAGLIETLFKEVSGTLVRIRTKKKLDLNERLFRSLAESSGEWIIRFNKACQHIYVNQAVVRSLKMNPEDIIGKNCEQLGYSKEYSKIIELRLSETFANQKPTQCEIELHLEGRSAFYEFKFYPEETLESVIVNARDITQRKEIEGKLMDSVSKKSKLYSIISHDLRTPFTSIVSFSNLLVSRYSNLTDDERMKYIRIIDEASQNSLQLFESILQWSLENNETDAIKPVYFDLGLLAKKTIGLHHVSISERRINISFNTGENVFVHADYNMIYTVLRNIISNAIKYSKPGGRIIISVMEEAETVVCKVENSGTAISSDLISSILNEKQAGKTKQARSTTGSGLGLKLTKEFVDYNHGKLWIKNKEGLGTIVSFTLPKGS